jgi:hypothetical protein
MKLTEEQRQRVTTWILDGVKLSDIQSRLAAEFGVKLTYMETRFLVDDLKLMPKDPEPPKTPEPAASATPPVPTAAAAPEAPADDVVEEDLPPAGAGSNVAVTVDQITQPGALISGKVTFSDGQSAAWYLDQTGRLGLVPKQPGYKPTAADVQAFQLALQREMRKLGY